MAVAVVLGLGERWGAVTSDYATERRWDGRLRELEAPRRFNEQKSGENAKRKGTEALGAHHLLPTEI